MDSQEEWRPVVGYEGLFKVSSLGRVKSFNKKKILTGTKISGYYKVCLCKNKVCRVISIHTLVCTAFHGPKPSPKHEVAHWDGNPLNNRSDNLRWATKIENCADKIRHGTVIRGEATYNNILSEVDVLSMRKLYKEGCPKDQIARRFHVSRTTVYDITHKRRWKWLK